ncbi:ATPase [Caulobacter sp. SLTY]|uniref:SRPBCC family protein n=1 Tax=Caulobacter sp. SLTY TaxID=2683262 RepID=UPI0014130519|nr:SRPBCC family protein [Caulobacter sp. SLTY]NBB17472.1 ATPase [Caulobacter sp. SLTY]
MRKLLMAAMTASVFAMAAPAGAEVKSTAEGRLVVENIVVIDATADKVYAALGQIGSWWESSHTYSGKAANMTLKLEPGACFCETLPGGGVKHGEVALAWPGKMLRITGALGPLQDLGVEGALTFTLTPTADGKTQVAQSYKVGGLDAAFMKNAPVIDMVVGTQLKRLKTFVETGKAG